MSKDTVINLGRDTDLAADIKRSFDLAVLRHEAGQLKDANDWRAFQTIRDRFSDERAALRETYQNSYPDRFNAARAELLRKASGILSEPKPRFAATDRFNREAIDRQAHRIVRVDHQNALSALEAQEARELSNLLKQSHEGASNDQESQSKEREHPPAASKEKSQNNEHTPVFPDRHR